MTHEGASDGMHLRHKRTDHGENTLQSARSKKRQSSYQQASPQRRISDILPQDCHRHWHSRARPCSKPWHLVHSRALGKYLSGSYHVSSLRVTQYHSVPQDNITISCLIKELTRRFRVPNRNVGSNYSSPCHHIPHLHIFKHLVSSLYAHKMIGPEPPRLDSEAVYLLTFPQSR